MATLLDTLQIKQIAFAWAGTTRVYRTDVLRVFGEEDTESWTLSSGRRQQVVEGVWLSFQIESNVLQRVSPSADSGNDWIDVKNAIINPVETVEFYPIWSIDNSVKYTVLSAESGQGALLETSRALFAPSVSMNIAAATRLDTYPDWLRVTRYRP